MSVVACPVCSQIVPLVAFPSHVSACKGGRR